MVKPKRQTAKPLRFYVHDPLYTTETEVQCEQITESLDAVFSKTTDLLLKFDGCVRWDGLPPPQIGAEVPTPQNHRFAVWLLQSDRVDGGNKRTAPDEYSAVGTTLAIDLGYRLPTFIAHELEHIFNIGVAEPSRARNMLDNTGVDPNAGVQDGIGGYWDTRGKLARDPMVSSFFWGMATAAEWAEYAEIAPMHSHIINEVLRGGKYYFDERFSVPANPYSVLVETEPGAVVSMYATQITSRIQTSTEPSDVRTASQDGIAEFLWGGVMNGQPLEHIATQGNQARLFAVHNPGFPIAKKWLTAWDLQAYKVLGGGAEGDFHYRGALTISLN